MATVVTDASSYSNGWPAGQVVLQVVFESYVNSGKATQVNNPSLTINDSSGTTVIASPALTAMGPGQYQYTWNIPSTAVFGDYKATWAGTRAYDNQAVTYVEYVTVAMPYSDAPEGVYATVAAYRARTLDTGTPDDLVQMRLQLASEQIEAQIVMAVYATDANGMPVSPRLAVILMNAVIEQCRYLCAKDDDSQAKDEYSSMSVAGISYSKAAGTTGSRMPRICPQAKAILHNGGVLQGAPLVNW